MTGFRRRCGKQYASKDEAMRSKKGRTGRYMAITCRCGRFHLQELVLAPIPSGTFLGAGKKPAAKGKRRGAIKSVSTKRAAENRERRAMKDRRWPDGERPRCARPGCPRLADDLHEILSRARGGSITDEANTVPLCRQCNGDATRDPADMAAAGLVRHSWEAA